MPKISTAEGDIVQFLRKRDYTLVRELGQGACGKTVLLHDPQIGERFVCKKYVPFSESHRQELFAGFIREIKILHKIHHENVVRVFNYYLYPDQFTGYILMEFIDGSEVDDYLARHPEQANEVFIQTICGFAYLQRSGILHRDIRPGNVMVREDGTVKIIDLGFGKEVLNSGDFEKSISLNWWCQPPIEFDESRYDFCSEVYFVGMLFEGILRDAGIGHFQYTEILSRMCQRNPSARIQTFAEIEKEIGTNQFYEIDFPESELDSYREFADAMCRQVTKIENGAKYTQDMAEIQSHIEEAYRSFMLEQLVPDAALVTRCFFTGTYYYRKAGLPVEAVRGFIRLMKSIPEDKKRIVLANLHTRFDVLPRYSRQEEDDFPF
jgi:predicted Ser/Thr protein kinase